MTGKSAVRWTARRKHIGLAIAAAALTAAGLIATQPVEASIGESFMAIPGIAEGGSSSDTRGWLRIEAHYWPSEDIDVLAGASRFRRGRTFFSGPPAPEEGPGTLAIAVDKRSPHLASLMKACAAETEIPAMRFRESSVRARSLAQIGARPEAIPEFYEYALNGVKFAGCPVVAEAPEQAFVLEFGDVAITNYNGPYAGVQLKLTPASLRPLTTSGETKAFVVSWLAVAHDVSDDQCPVMNAKPTEDDYYALKSKEEAERIRAQLAAEKSGVSYENEQMAHRGPMSLNAALLPGIVKDPGHVVPQSTVARGLDLDGDDGSGKPPAGVCRHKNYQAPDGRKGIDNQLFTVQGCVPGYMGHKGFLMQYRNEQYRNGQLSLLVVVSGIDDERNDDHVEVSIVYSGNPMTKSADGKTILGDYTYSLTDNAENQHYFQRLTGRIENGAVVTDLVDELRVHTGGIFLEIILYKAGLRFEIQPDGSMKGVIGGYEDWRRTMTLNNNSRAESLYGFQAPGMYNAFKRYADGLKDPETGQCLGISAAYDIEGSPAFLTPEDLTSHIVHSGDAVRRNR
jgi:hypothetical protein